MSLIVIVRPVVILVVISFYGYVAFIVREHWVQVVILQDLQVITTDDSMILYSFIFPIG